MHTCGRHWIHHHFNLTLSAIQFWLCIRSHSQQSSKQATHTKEKRYPSLIWFLNNNFCLNFSIYFPSAFRARAKIINLPPVCIQLIFGELFLFWQVAILILPEQVTTRNRREKQNKKICVFFKRCTQRSCSHVNREAANREQKKEHLANADQTARAARCCELSTSQSVAPRDVGTYTKRVTWTTTKKIKNSRRKLCIVCRSRPT